jgi:tripartite-type tricarboxylate transporter receptor subunit TctC
MTDLIGGQIHLMFENVATAIPFVKSAKVRALGVTGRQRAASLPELPTIAESGVPDYEAVPYYTISTGAKVPGAIVRRLNADIESVLKHPEVAARWLELGITPLGGPAEDAAKRNAVETEKWTRVIRAAKISVD